MLAIVVTFWIASLLVLYTYIGYPVLLALIVRRREQVVRRDKATPSVSILVCAWNEERGIGAKIENLLSLDYPTDEFEILVATDGSVDRTDEIVRGFASRGVRLFSTTKRMGKPSNLSLMAAEARGEILVCSDTRQMFRNDALRKLVAPFADPTVGCVSGSLEVSLNGHAIGDGAGFYRKYEQWIRVMEGRLDTMLGAAGAIYALRRNLFVAPPADTILDDFEIPMAAVLSGYRTILEPEAVAYDQAPSSSKEEFSRKARTLAGNYQSLARSAGIWIPFKSRVAWQLISHKGLRLVCPALLICALATSIALYGRHPFYSTALALQATFYGAALAAPLLKGPRLLRRVLGPPYAFVVMNMAAVAGLIRFLRRSQAVTWERAAQ